MLDVTALVLQDHETLRRQFALLDDAHSPAALEAVWTGLGRMLDVHAACEEEIFYPSLLKEGDKEDAVDETDDAIDDHNKIRDAVAAAGGHEVGSKAWWDAVRTADEENSKHIAEEERNALVDFRRHASDELREELAAAWLTWRYEHETTPGRRKPVDTDDKDPDAYISAHT